jgi:hypothetical protein
MSAQLSQLHDATTYPGKALPLTLLPGEDVLLTWEMQSRAEELIVTTHRIRLSRRAIGWRWTSSMLLESLIACTLDFRSRLIFIVLAVLSPIVGMGWTLGIAEWLPLICSIGLGVLFVVLYVRSRDQVVEFTAPGTTIKVRSSGRSLDDVRQLVETVEAAKNARYIQRFHSAAPNELGPETANTLMNFEN